MRHDEIYLEIYKRTGISANTIHRVLWTYFDIIKECLIDMVEVPLGDIGTLSWKVIPPKKKEANVRLKEDAPGYICTKLRVNKTWRSYLKGLTSFWDNEEEESK